MSLRLELDVFQHYDPGRSSATVNVWLAHPSPSEEQAFGKLMVLSSFDRVTRVNHEIIALIQEELRSQLYQSLEVGFDRAFERALVQTNQRLHEAIAEGVNQWLAGANILVVAIKQQTLLAAHVGQVHAYIIRRERLHPILSAGDRIEPNPLRMFGHVVSGELEPADRLLFCTTSLLDYFSLEKLRRLFIDHRPADVVRQMEATLLSAEPHHAVAAIALEAVPSTETVPVMPRPGTSVGLGVRENAPQASMNRLLSRQQATEELLTPSIWPAIRDVLQSIGRGISSFLRTTILRKPARRVVPGMMPPSALRPHSPAWGSRVVRLLASWVAALSSAVRQLFRRRPKLSTERPELRAAGADSPRQWLHRLVGWFTSLGRVRQLAIAGVVLVLISLSAAISWRGHQSSTASHPSDAPAQIRQLIAQAQAALLYGGDATASTAVAHADELYAQLPHRTKAEQTTRQQLLQELNAIHLRVDHVNTIANPTQLASLSHLAVALAPRQLYHLGTTVVAVDPQHSRLAKLADHGQPTAKTFDLTLDTGALTTGTIVGTSTLVFVTDRLTFVQFDTAKETWKPLDSAFPETQSRVQSLASYLGRIYALETNHQDIIRFNPGGNSLGRGVSWLKTAAALTSARQLAVDGSIYVLQPKGQVQLFQTGRLSTFALTQIHPSISNITRLWTDANSQHLYLLEPGQRRILVTDKQGHLIDQYTSPSWTDLRDMTANEKTKTLYVLNGTSVQTVTLVH